METNIVREFDKKISDETIINIPRKKTYDEIIDELEEENENLASNMPWNTTEQATEISVDDAAKYSRNKLELFGNTYQLSLPSGYTHLEYIESTGTQYINLDYVIKSNTKLEIEYQTEKVRSNTLFGSSNNNINYYASGLAGGTAQTGQDSPTTIKVSANLSTEKTSLLWERAQVTYNGNIVTGNFGLDDSSLVLFKNRRWPNDLGKVKLYKFIAYDGNIIAANYIPCKNSNNEIGLYDVVSNTFYGNSGTGDLVAGTDLGTLPSSDYPQDIHVVSGENTIGVQGKNLLYGSGAIHPYVNAYINTITGEPIIDGQKFIFNSNGDNQCRIAFVLNLKPNTQYTISWKDIRGYNSNNIDVSELVYASYIKEYTNNDGLIVPISGQTTALNVVDNSTSFTTNYNSEHAISITLSGSKIRKIIYDSLMIEESPVKTNYQPYYHKNYPLNLGSIKIGKIGDYQDKFVKDNGVWKIPNKIVKIDSYNGETITTPYISTTGGLDIGATIYYVGNVEYTITDETLIAQLDEIYEHLKLVKVTNNITVTAEDLAPYMQLTYMQDLPSKLDKLEAMIIENS